MSSHDRSRRAGGFAGGIVAAPASASAAAAALAAFAVVSVSVSVSVFVSVSVSAAVAVAVACSRLSVERRRWWCGWDRGEVEYVVERTPIG